MFENDTKIYLKMKIKRLLSIEKIIIKCEKMCYYNYNKNKVMTQKILLMKNRLKLNMRMF